LFCLYSTPDRASPTLLNGQSDLAGTGFVFVPTLDVSVLTDRVQVGLQMLIRSVLLLFRISSFIAYDF
jgi:hypothetical protein